MANNCENKVTLRHTDPAMIKRVKRALRQGKLFAEFIPDCTHWGDGQRDVGGEIIDSDANEIEINFLSRWEPPRKVFTKLSEMGFVIDAYYNEGGDAFCGNWTSEGGDSFYSYEGLSVDEVIAKIPAEIDIRFVISDTMAEEIKWNESFTQPQEN